MVGIKAASRPSLKVKAIAARYVLSVRALEIEFENGIVYRYPVNRLNFSRWNGTTYEPIQPEPTDTELEAVELWPNGDIVEFETIEQGFEVAELIREIVA